MLGLLTILINDHYKSLFSFSLVSFFNIIFEVCQSGHVTHVHSINRGLFLIFYFGVLIFCLLEHLFDPLSSPGVSICPLFST